MKNKMFKGFLLFVVWLAAFNSVACAQQLIDVTDKKEVLIDIEHLGKPGKIKKYLIQNGDKPINPPIANAYQIVEKKYYKVETDAIAFGTTIAAFNVPVGQENFIKARILHLVSNELSPNGLQWQDCTITPDKLGNPADAQYSVSYTERLRKFLPDFSQKTVSCELENALKAEEFFVVALQSQSPPTEAFTKIEWSLETKDSPSKNGAVTYKLIFTNTGTKDIAEFNFRSMFDVDTKLNSLKPSQGDCRASDFGASWGSAVCHTGKIPVGKSVALELEAEPSGMDGNPNPSGKKNEHWGIYGFLKQSPNDPEWNANAIAFEPITKINLTEIKK